MLKKIKNLFVTNLQSNGIPWFIILFVLSLTIYCAGVFRVKSFIWGDSLYYYAYTRSIVMDRNIDFSNEAFHPKLGFPNKPEFSSRTGLITNKFSPGASLLWIPGFILGQSLSVVGNLFINFVKNSGSMVGIIAPTNFETLEAFFTTDGFGFLPQLFVSVSALSASVGGLWFVYKTLCIWFQKQIAVLTSLVLLLSTPLFYYTALDPVNSHSGSFLLSAILLYRFSKFLQIKHARWQDIILMGIISGLLMLVRNQDFVILIPILSTIIFAKKENFLDKLNWFVLFGGTVFIIFSVQLVFTVQLFGILGSPYLIRGENLSWLNPDFIRVLFSKENGLFFFSPVLLFAVIFLVRMFKKNNLIAVVALVTFLLQLYVVASWGREIIGGPYGSRMFVSILPHLSIGLAYFIIFLQQKLSPKKFISIFALTLFILFCNMMIQTGIMLYHF